jgi:hypothetical protein
MSTDMTKLRVFILTSTDVITGGAHLTLLNRFTGLIKAHDINIEIRSKTQVFTVTVSVVKQVVNSFTKYVMKQHVAQITIRL